MTRIQRPFYRLQTKNPCASKRGMESLWSQVWLNPTQFGVARLQIADTESCWKPPRMESLKSTPQAVYCWLIPKPSECLVTAEKNFSANQWKCSCPTAFAD